MPTRLKIPSLLKKMLYFHYKGTLVQLFGDIVLILILVASLMMTIYG